VSVHTDSEGERRRRRRVGHYLKYQMWYFRCGVSDVVFQMWYFRCGILDVVFWLSVVPPN